MARNNMTKEVSPEIIEKALRIYGKKQSNVIHFILKSGGKIEYVPKDPSKI